MNAQIIIMVLMAAFFHAVWNASVKLSDDKVLSITGIQGTTVLMVLPLVPFVGLPEPESWPYLLASVALHLGYYIALASAYQYGDFSQAYPVARGTAPILVTFWGVFVLHESLSVIELVSVVGVITGIMIFATRRLGVVLHDRKALAGALVTSCFIGGYTIVDGIGGRLSLNVPAYMVWLAILDGSPMVLYAIRQRSLAQVIALKSKWRISLFGSVLSLAAYWMVVSAMTQAPIPLVSAIRETSIIIAALIGAYYFKEPAGKRRIVASIVIFISIALLGWSDS